MMGRYPMNRSFAKEDPGMKSIFSGFWMSKYEITQGQWQAIGE